MNKKPAPDGYANSLQAELRRRMPRTYERRLTSRLAAVRLFCVECVGGAVRDAMDCQTTQCFLYPHRGASWVPAVRLRKRQAARSKPGPATDVPGEPG